MKFDKENFSKILIKIKDSYGSINQMAEKTQITSAYISKLIRLMYDNAPSPDILWKISSNSNGIASYFDLMEICGYIKEQDTNIEIYAKNVFEKILQNTTDNTILKKIFNSFITYLNDFKDSLVFKNGKIVKEISYYVDFNVSIFKPFVILHNSFIELLLKRKKIYRNYADLYILASTIYDGHFYMNNDFSLKLFQYDETMCLNNKAIQDIIDIMWLYSTTLRYWYSSYINDNLDNMENNITYVPTQYYHCPVYGTISAGQPNWAEECLEGYLPIDPVLMNIIDPEDHFFLRVNGESMNKVIRNGAYALIHKQDAVENGEIAVVLVNGFEATLKKFSKQGDLVILEPMSDDTSFNTQVYSNDTEIKILGKYVGKFEMNK